MTTINTMLSSTNRLQRLLVRLLELSEAQLNALLMAPAGDLHVPEPGAPSITPAVTPYEARPGTTGGVITIVPETPQAAVPATQQAAVPATPRVTQSVTITSPPGIGNITRGDISTVLRPPPPPPPTPNTPNNPYPVGSLRHAAFMLPAVTLALLQNYVE